MTNEQVLELLRKTGVLLEGHFKLTSGLHAAKYMQCAQLLQYPVESEILCREIAANFKDEGVTVVIGPATGAIIISYEVARAMGTKSLFTEREAGGMALRRGFKLSPNDRVLVVEDVVTTGGSVKEVIKVVEESGATVVGVGVIVDRSSGRADFGYPLKSLVKVEIQTHKPEDCPLCAAGSVAVKPGSRNI